MAQILRGIEITATFAASLLFSCLGLLALAKFGIDLAQTLRGKPFNLSSEADDGERSIWRRDRFKTVAGLLVLLATSAILFWLSYALARRAMTPNL